MVLKLPGYPGVPLSSEAPQDILHFTGKLRLTSFGCHRLDMVRTSSSRKFYSLLACDTFDVCLCEVVD